MLRSYMPYAASRLCSKCLRAFKGSRCASCERIRQSEVDKRRTTKDRTFYQTTEWKLIRTAQLQRRPFCEAQREGQTCNGIANHVDHIVAREAGGSDLPVNLQSLCLPCHSRKTVLQDGGFGRSRPTSLPAARLAHVNDSAGDTTGRAG